MENKPFDPTKPIQTRDGRKARILCTDLKFHNCPIAAAILYDHLEHVYAFSGDGKYNGGMPESPIDLINIPEKLYGFFFRADYREEWCVCMYAFKSNEARERHIDKNWPEPGYSIINFEVEAT